MSNMGNMQALAYAESVNDGLATLEMALSAHFASNHFPPLPQELVPVAVDIIYSYDPYGDDDTIVDLPEGVTWRGMDMAPASACIEAWHLGAFIEALWYDCNEEDEDE